MVTLNKNGGLAHMVTLTNDGGPAHLVTLTKDGSEVKMAATHVFVIFQSYFNLEAHIHT